MKVKNVALLSFAGMLLSSASVYSFGGGPKQAGTTAEVTVSTAGGGTETPPSDEPKHATFEDGTTLRVEGRMGHPKIALGTGGETFVLVDVKGGEGARAATSARSRLAIVIDRSGSMKGDRIANAIQGATAAIDHLGDGDTVSVTAFDTKPTLVVPSTVVNGGNREQIKAEIRKITLGGDTCISCGLEEAMVQLVQGNGTVDRMILLSDGDATAGVRDVAGFKAITDRARAKGISVTTIGVGVSYNQKILGSIAQQSGGGHYFIEDTSSLEKVFQAEAEKLRSTVAAEVEASIELGQGVELDRVFDRSFRMVGRRVVVQLGSFARGDAKTVLMRVRVPTRAEGEEMVADVSVAYRDLVTGQDGRAAGGLGVVISRDAAGSGQLDALVNGRLQRSETAAVLLQANELFERGQGDEARRKIAAQQQALATAASEARHAAPKAKKGAVDRDFEGQASALSNAGAGLDKPAPAPAAQRAVRARQEAANPFME